MPWNLIKLNSKFKWVTWSLLSKSLARTCTLPAPESQNGQRLAAPRLHSGIVHESVKEEVFSGKVQLRNAGLVQDGCHGLAIQSSKTGCTSIGMI